MTGQPQSPDILGGTPRRGAGVRRLNRVPLVIAFLLACAVLGAVTYTYQTRLAEQRRQAREQEARPEPASLGGVFRDAPDGGLIPADRPPAPPPPPVLAAAEPEKPLVEQPDPAWEAYRQQVAQRRQAREQATLQALAAPTRINQGLPNGLKQAAASPDAAADSPTGQLAALYAADALHRRNAFDAERADINQAEAKRRFLAEGASPQNQQAHYLPAGREFPLSPYELKAGTVIPAVMVGGVSSDLPGQIVGQVSENVYDTATGRYVLIPQGSKLVGTYDNGITTGQERVLVAWTRIIYPDASSIDLGRMPGADEAGYAGFHDRVNDHFWKVFGKAVMLSLFTGGLQLSQGQGNNANSNGMNAQQTMTAALGQQMGQLGMEMARRNMMIQPTLEIRPGYRFVVQVTKDIVIRPWQSRAAAQ